MKCPMCGDDMSGGRCRFCGYRETESDRSARSRYEAQKRELAGEAPQKQKPLSRPARSAKPAGKKPDRQPPRREAKPRAGPPAKAAPSRPGRKHGRLKRFFFAMLVAGWVLAYMMALYGAWDAKRESGAPAGGSAYLDNGPVCQDGP